MYMNPQEAYFKHEILHGAESIRAAIFDMDGTMYDTERIYAEGWRLGAEHYGYKLTDEMICEFHGRSPDENAMIFRGWFGEEAPYWDVRAIRSEYVDRKVRENGIPIKTGLFELLNVLREKGIRIAVATGTSRKRAEPYWAKTGVDAYLSASICGNEVTHGKPHPEIFERAAALLDTPPGKCLVFEDSPNGIRAAHAAGCHIFVNPDMDPITEEMRELSDYILRDLAEAAQIIEYWNDKERT